MRKRKLDELLDHDADGIQEYDNDLPRWWLYGFYFTIAFAIFYLINWHVIKVPIIGEKGMIAEYEVETQKWNERLANASPTESEVPMILLTDQASLSRGREVYESMDQLCTTCHRQDLGGMVGPNLTDDLWLHGCSLEDIVVSIKNGFPDKGMLPYGSNNRIAADDLVKLASYIISMRGTNPSDPKPADPDRDIRCDVMGPG